MRRPCGAFCTLHFAFYTFHSRGGATPFGSANLPTGFVPGNEAARLHKKPNPRRGFSGPPGPSARSVAANTLGLGPSDRRCKSCRADQFNIAAVAEHTRH